MLGLALLLVGVLRNIVGHTKRRTPDLLCSTCPFLPTAPNIALRYASFGYILETGRVVLDGAAEALRTNEDVREFYLGVAGENRRSFKHVKSYKRRKRWLA